MNSPDPRIRAAKTLTENAHQLTTQIQNDTPTCEGLNIARMYLTWAIGALQRAEQQQTRQGGTP